MARPFVIFDRDGTLIRHVHYLADPNMVELQPGLIPGLKLLEDHGFDFGMVTNQSIISRGLATPEQVDAVNTRVLELLEQEGIKFQFVLLCPHTPEDSCNCRKPAIGLGQIAIQKHKLDPSSSFMLGDQPSDVIFGHALGCRSIQIGDEKSPYSEADFHADNVLLAAQWITSVMKRS